MFELLEGLVRVEQTLEGAHRHLDREHDRVDRDARPRHPKNEHHHRQLAQRRLSESPRFLKSKIRQ